MRLLERISRKIFINENCNKKKVFLNKVKGNILFYFIKKDFFSIVRCEKLFTVTPTLVSSVWGEGKEFVKNWDVEFFFANMSFTV